MTRDLIDSLGSAWFCAFFLIVVAFVVVVVFGFVWAFENGVL